MIVIICNGPANTGKDVLCEELREYINKPGFSVVHMEFKELLFDFATRAAGVSRELWDALYDRKYKERPTPYLQVDGKSVSPREWMIHCSENVMKPIFGKDVLGKAFSSKLEELEMAHEGNEVVVAVSDGGFIEESLPAVEYASPSNFFICRLHRLNDKGEEYNFDGDSRNYLYADDYPHNLRPYDTDIFNEEDDLTGTAKKVCDWVGEIKGVIFHE